jgi:hypothetical protein
LPLRIEKSQGVTRLEEKIFPPDDEEEEEEEGRAAEQIAGKEAAGGMDASVAKSQGQVSSSFCYCYVLSLVPIAAFIP